MEKLVQIKVKTILQKLFFFLLLFCFVQMNFLKAQNQGWDLSSLIEGNIVDIVSLYPEGCAFLTDENEIGYYDSNEKEYIVISDGIVEVRIFDPNGNFRDEMINISSFNFTELAAGHRGGYNPGFYMLTDEGLAINYNTSNGNIIATPLYETSSTSSKPIFQFHTLSNTGDGMDYIWGVGVGVGDNPLLALRMYPVISSINASDEFRQGALMNDIQNATEDLSFNGSHLSGRNCVFAWDNDNRKILILDESVGISSYEVISYDDLPIDISNISWMNTVKYMTYFDDERYRLQNAFIFIKTDDGKLFKYWFHSGSRGFSEYRLMNYGSVGGLHDLWAIWSDVSSDFDDVEISRIGNFLQTTIGTFRKELIFPIEGSTELLKYDIVTGETCFIPMDGLFNNPILGCINAYNRSSSGQYAYFYSPDKIFTIELGDLFNMNCNLLSSSRPEREVQNKGDLFVHRVDNDRIKVQIINDTKLVDYAEIYRIDGKKVDEISGELLLSSPILTVPMNSMYLIVGVKNGEVVVSQKFF